MSAHVAAVDVAGNGTFGSIGHVAIDTAGAITMSGGCDISMVTINVAAFTGGGYAFTRCCGVKLDRCVRIMASDTARTVRNVMRRVVPLVILFVMLDESAAGFDDGFTRGDAVVSATGVTLATEV